MRLCPNEKYLATFFNLSEREWLLIFRYQKRKCGICGKKLESKGDVKLDHDHLDGCVRGILCFRCNSVLGELFTLKFVKKVFRYLKHPPATEALGRKHYGLPGRVGTKKQRKLAKKLRRSG